MKALIGIIFIFIGSQIFGQDSLTVKITVTDANYSQTIPNTQINIQQNNLKWQKTTNVKGETFIKIPFFKQLSFHIQHTQYEPIFDIKNISSRYKNDTISVYFELFHRKQNFEEIVVTAPGIPVTVFGSKRVHVEDFEVLPNGNVLLLTYSKRLKKGNELKLFNGEEVIQSFQINERAIELIRDFRGNPHLVCEKNVYGIFIESEKIGIATLDKNYFLKYVAPIVDTNLQRMYFSTHNPHYPAFEYFEYDRVDSLYNKVIGIKDSAMMELYRSEYKWADVRTQLFARTQEMHGGIDAKDWVGANYFTRSLYYKELYAPLFHRNDSLIVLDYYKDLLFVFDKEGNPLDSIGIFHHYQPKRTGWKRNVIQDKITGQIYATYERGGYTFLGQINVKTGEIEQQVQLEYKFIQKVAVHNNFVYYIYRPFESIQKKYLYKEKLP